MHAKMQNPGTPSPENSELAGAGGASECALLTRS